MNSNTTGQQAVFGMVYDSPVEWKELKTSEERQAVKDFMKWIIENRNQESSIKFHSSPSKGVTRAEVSGFKNYHLK
jgi:hypothetical protein